MDKQLIERIALEEAQEFFSMATTNPLVFKCHIPEFATRFLARIDAERGKEAAVFTCQSEIENTKKSLPGTISGIQTAHWPIPLFLSQTIPLGYALVPIEPTQEMCEQAYYEFNAEQKDFDAANLWRSMLSAAQGERK